MNINTTLQFIYFNSINNIHVLLILSKILESENPLKYEIGGNLCNDATISFLRSERLGAKRIQLCLSFALKFQNWFSLSEVPDTKVTDKTLSSNIRE